MPDQHSFEPCPFCGKPVSKTAERCPHCAEELYEDVDDDLHHPRGGGDASADAGLKWLVPIGRSGWAIAAGYMGLFSCFPFVGIIFGPAAIACGVLALAEVKRKPGLSGQGRAIFGIIVGSLCFVFNLLMLLVILASR
jgi:hypothetical protein